MFVIGALVNPAASWGDKPKALPQRQAAVLTPFVEASYGYSAETTSVHVEVKGGKLRYTYNGKNSKLKPGVMPMRQEPYYTQADMVTVVAPLSTAELVALEKQIRTSGFLKLKPVYDDKPKQRSYPLGVMGAVKGKKLTVAVRHGTVPVAFFNLEKTLKQLVQKYFPTAPRP